YALQYAAIFAHRLVLVGLQVQHVEIAQRRLILGPERQGLLARLDGGRVHAQTGTLRPRSSVRWRACCGRAPGARRQAVPGPASPLPAKSRAQIAPAP